MCLLRFIAVAFLVVFSAASGVDAQERILQYDVAVVVQTSGDIDIEETIRVNALGREIRRGIFRDLPRLYEDPETDGNLRYRYDVKSVQRNGKRETFATLTEGQAFRIMIGNEVHALRCFHAGDSWWSLIGRIAVNAKAFRKNPHWTKYNYEIPNPENSKNANPIQIIGDKKAGGSVFYSAKNPELLPTFRDWLPIPLKVIHMIRHPFDVIATTSLKNGLSLDHNITRYFIFEKNMLEISKNLGEEHYLPIYQEDLIDNPLNNLTRLFSFLKMESEETYIKACCSFIFKQARKSRFKVEWTLQQKELVEARIQEVEHLKYYSG